MNRLVKTKKYAALAVVLLFSLAILLSACTVALGESENLEEVSIGSRDLPENTESVRPKPTPEATPDEVPDGEPDEESEEEPDEEPPAHNTGNESDYAEMPGPFGKSRNRRGYTASDARGVTQENFLKLSIGMDLSDIQAIFSDSDAESSVYSDSEVWYFKSDITRVTVDIKDGGLHWASYRDDYRVCVDESDVSMAKFRQLKEGMSLSDVIGLLGGNFFINNISSITSADAARYVWVSDEGEIEVAFNTSDKVSAFMQEGLRYEPDTRMQHPVLTNRQLLDNFANVELGVGYAALEGVMGNYIPLFYTTVGFNFRNVADYYIFSRDSRDGLIKIEFKIEDGELYEKEIARMPDELLPETDISSANKVEEDMTYDEVKEILGEGLKISEKLWLRDQLDERYKWRLPGDEYGYGHVEVVLSNGVVEYILTYDVFE